MTDNASDPLVCVGELTSPHGVRGQMRVRSFTENPEAIFSYKPLMKADGSTVAISRKGVVKEFFIVSLAGIADKNAADAWRQTKLYVRRSQLPQTNDDEYYLSDLEGLQARLTDGSIVGKVTALFNFGAGDVLEIARKGEEPLLLAFTDDCVPEVNVAAGYVVISPPDEIIAKGEGDGEDDEDAN